MSKASNPISVRLPPKARAALDRAAKAAKTTRSEIINLALERQLPLMDLERRREGNARRYARILALAGSGAALSTYTSGEDVIAEIRKGRDQERGV